jgi:hypothetical protein
MSTLGSILRNKLYCVIYRTGGTDNFQWQRSVAMTREEADKALQDVVRMGYPAHIEKYHLSMSVGLPEGYEYARP